VKHNKPRIALYVFNGLDLLIVWRKGLSNLSEAWMPLAIYHRDLWEQFQLGKYYFKKIEYQNPTSLDTKIRRNIILLQRILPVGHDMCEKLFHRYEFKLPSCQITCALLFQHFVGE
jgi:hypothetical protein